MISKIDKSKLLDQVNKKTLEEFNIFYQCKNCKKIYWEGSHYDNMTKFINSIK